MEEFTLDPTNEQRRAALFRCLEFVEQVYNHRSEDGSLPFGTIDYYGMEDLISEIKAALFDPNQPSALLTADEIERATGRESWMCVNCKWFGEYSELVHAAPWVELCPECECVVMQVDKAF